MAKRVSYTELAHQVVRDSPEPLTVDEIVARVNEIAPITTRNPKSTIRGAVTQSWLIVNTGEGRYGWKPRVINGSLLRHGLTAPEVVQKRLTWDYELESALWPDYSASQKYRTLGNPVVTLPDGSRVELMRKMYGPGDWGSEANAAFWDWLKQEGAEAGDSLLFRVVDGEERRYTVTYEPWGDRDEAAIRERNQALAEISLQMENRPYGAAPWEIASHLLATGFYKSEVAPDTVSEVWEHELLDLVQDEESDIFDDLIADELSALFLESLFGEVPGESYGVEAPELPPEYEPGRGRRSRPSEKARTGTARIYTFRVTHRAYPNVWRDIELAEDQTLEDLHLTIQNAYRWDDDHLYSFFLSGRAWDRESEVGSPWSEAMLQTHQVHIGDLKIEEGQGFLYLFDYGDGHEFDVVILKISEPGVSGKYPRIVKRHGKAPPQYPDYDDEAWF